MRRFVRGALIAFALYWATLFVLMHVPVPVQSPAPHFDKVVHFLAYAGLGVGMIVVLPSAWRRSLFGLLFAIGAAWLYGVVDEIIQGFVPGRSADLLDWCADTAGAAVGATVAWTVAGLSRLGRRKAFDRPVS